MKLKHLKITNEQNSSFNIRRDSIPKYHNSWHYHTQLELVMICKGTGSLYLGDTIKDFAEGTCVLIGSDIPHFWLFHNMLEAHETQSIDCVVIHFNYDFAGEELFTTPELSVINNLLIQSEKGLIFTIPMNAKIVELFNLSVDSTKASKFTYLISILDLLTTYDKENIVSDNYSQLNNSNDEQRMKNVMNYIRDNYSTKIELNDLSNEAKMTKNSFCRYFKQKTGKTPTVFINELRIAHACRLLKNTDMTLKQICFDSGFNNFVSFHKIFKQQTNQTPLYFRKLKN